MNRYLLLVLIFFSHIALIGCAHHTPPLTVDLTKETWMREVYTNPSQWNRGASNWFLTGDPHASGMAISPSPYYPIVFSSMNIEAPRFNKIILNGDFEVQIFGTAGLNTVNVYGPNEAVRDTIADVKGDTLYINQVKKPHPSIRHVTIRIGVNCLNELVQLGSGKVEGIQIHSNFLRVASFGPGAIYLSGSQMNLNTVRNMSGSGITIMGVSTPVLDIETKGIGGWTNVSGNVGIRSIKHNGRNDINIIGANSNASTIYARGRGKIGIFGNVRLNEVKAYNYTRVYVNGVNSMDLHAYAYGYAHIGLAGVAHNVYIDAVQSACVGARNLCADAVYARATDWGHINVAASTKAFASASGDGSVYYFGEQTKLTRFGSGDGIVVPLRAQTPCCIVAKPIYGVPYRLSFKGERPVVKSKRLMMSPTYR